MFLARLWCMVAGRPALDRSPSAGPGALVQAVRTCGQPRGAGPGRGARFLLCASVLLVLGWSWALPVPAQSEQVPALRFTSPTEFHLHPDARLRPRGGEEHADWQGYAEGAKERYLATITGEQSGGGSLVFAAEGHSGEFPTYCYESNCGPVRVGVLSGEEGGLLYLGVDIDAPRRTNGGVNTRKLRRMRHRFHEVSPQRVELSVRAGRQKVYQEVRVTAPADAPECGDYPEMNEDRYRCYFTREAISPAFKEVNSPLVAELPGQLVQDRGEYEVVFAEEFEGTYASFDTYADNCDRGLAELDENKWLYQRKTCRPNPQEAPCEYLKGGHLHISGTSQCGGGITSLGLFEPKYGYVEIRYTIGTTLPPDGHRPNYNVVIGDTSRADYHLLFNTYNLPLDSLERLLTLAGWVEIDFFEYLPKNKSVISHQYRNWGRPPEPVAQHAAVRPMLTYKYRFPCSGGSHCQGVDRLTITEGMEWTPGGYLFLRRVHGRRGRDEMQIISQYDTTVYESRRRDANGNWLIGFGGERRVLYGEEKEPYFVQLDPNDPAFYLEAVGISHRPNKINVGSWTDEPSPPLTNQSELTIDYIRVFQPRNRYADMEPLYQ